ncbi:trichothecene 3-O-acetyltransferase [Schizosaccharomyces japonicus yFS275]|uniref:Trichothecene 3-O-acetyltransferase n=1 Tax=Schizosaccharomyces japonicus (strain yFS275 / FY16936) TaxID=402676 RepID=B6JUX7_SCHJY|nr:trichothecene 3-O-acetyltransferase [Schizosaccharomyces japonicus yFS275]EEB05080.1 trichothecene 3-O-acetyltransferase [Schizosaccharomyces japonicus yFS275]
MTISQNVYYSLDPMGQLPIPCYIQLCLFYEVEDPSSYQDIEKTLKSGLQRLSASFPWIAGEVVINDTPESSLKTKRIKFTNNIPLIIKDLRNDPSVPTMKELQKAQFPIQSLAENVIAPHGSIIIPSPAAQSEPVFLVQANYLVGGLLLAVTGHHSAMDITGLGEVLRLFSKACHDEPFSSEELAIGNIDRQNIVPLFDESYTPGPELAQQIRTSEQKPSLSNKDKSKWLLSPQKCSWGCFVFSQDSLSALKQLACSAISDSGKYVSTDDSLTALIHQSVVRSRLPRLDSTADVTCSRVVNVRKFLDIPSGYPGFLINPTYHTYKIETLLKEALGNVALELRSALDPSDLVYRTRALSTYISRIEDKSVISLGARINAGEGVMLSSWSKVNCCDLDFNLQLGKPKSIRIPNSVPFEGVTYLLPKGPNGEVAAAICLRDDDMELLKADEKFTKYATYVG